MALVQNVKTLIGSEYSNIRHAYKTGKRYARINNKNSLYTGIKAVKKKVGYIPTVGAALGTCTPIPGGTVIGYSGGKILQKVLSIFAKVLKK